MHDAGGAALIGCALDVETTGLDHRRHSIIELALQRFWADASGRILATGRRHAWFEDPGVPITEEITMLTGIRQEDVAGRSIFDPEAASLIADAHFVVAHNATFDRPFVERRLPFAAGRPWVCSMRDVDWREHGYEGRALNHLLMQMGWFYDAHRAQSDVTALLHLLDHPLGLGTVLRTAVRQARKPTWRVVAAEAPFSARTILKERGYRWTSEARLWSREVPEHGLDQEIGWACQHVYSGRSRPRYSRITWSERYAAS